MTAEPQEKKKDLLTRVGAWIFKFSCCIFFYCLFFSTFQFPVHLIYKCYYCDHDAYFCVAEISVMIFESLRPSSPCFDFIVCFRLNLENVVQSHVLL